MSDALAMTEHQQALDLHQRLSAALYQREIELATSSEQLRDIQKRMRKEDAAINKWVAFGGPFPVLA